MAHNKSKKRNTRESEESVWDGAEINGSYLDDYYSRNSMEEYANMYMDDDMGYDLH
jgi:hypothetical protein